MKDCLFYCCFSREIIIMCRNPFGLDEKSLYLYVYKYKRQIHKVMYRFVMMYSD